MNKVVVDTNVLISANGRNIHADDICQLACIRKINTIREAQTVYLDEQNLIFNEYKNHLHFSGEPGVGDAFFKYIYNRQFSGSRVGRVPITPSSNASKGFEELPENQLDPSDRKFLAVAMVADASIVNATDSDWHENRTLLDSIRIEVEQLCPHMLAGRNRS